MINKKFLTLVICATVFLTVIICATVFLKFVYCSNSKDNRSLASNSGSKSKDNAALASNTNSNESTSVNTEKTTTTSDSLNQKELSMSGTINNNLNVHMKLNFSNKEVSGTYYYDKYNIPIKLKGTYASNTVTMNEFDDNGNVTGIFTGDFSTNGEFNGTWSTPDGTKKMSFAIYTINNETNSNSTDSSPSVSNSSNMDNSAEDNYLNEQRRQEMQHAEEQIRENQEENNETWRNIMLHKDIENEQHAESFSY